MGSSHTYANVGDTQGSRDHGYKMTKQGFTTELHNERQGKHIRGHRNFQPNRSVVYGGMKGAQALITEGAGTGTMIGPNKERVKFNRIIGLYADKEGNRHQTSNAIIHYSKDGAHIVPARPEGD